MKKTSLKNLAFIVALMFALTTLFVACGQNPEPTKTPETKQEEAKKEEAKGVEGDITIAGSTSVQPLTQDLADMFMEANKDVTIDVQGGGSSAGVKAAIDGTADIGQSSRDLKDTEKKEGLTEYVIAIDGIAVCVHPNNKVADLKKDDIVKIFKGEIKNWKDVGGADKPIVVVSREAGSGTRGAFEEILKLEKDGKSLVVNTALVQEGNGAVKAALASKEDAIGYLSLGYVDNSVKSVKVDGVEATEENIKAKKYPVARPFLMLTKGDLKPHVKAFIDYVLSDKGQEVVKSKHYIKVK